ncbi:MAG: DNA phosphorothioation-associated protein 4 [Nibricoccus sp.]
MPRRIEYAKQYEDFVQNLVRGDDTTGPFENKARCLTYAAAFGASYGKNDGRLPLPAKSSERAEPIRYDVFHSSGFEDLICSLAVFATGDLKILENSETAADRRITIFEEFANRGLEKLKIELTGETNLTEGLMLILKKQRTDASSKTDAIDWSKITSS